MGSEHAFAIHEGPRLAPEVHDYSQGKWHCAHAESLDDLTPLFTHSDMPIQIRCQCGKALKIPDNAAGKAVKCPGCGKTMKVPAAGGAGRGPAAGPAASPAQGATVGARVVLCESRPHGRPV